MQRHSFSCDGHTLNYAAAGAPGKPPLLMIHGYTSSYHVWRTTVPALERQMYCVAVDLLGHGYSPIDSHGDHSIEAQGRRVLALADTLGLDRFSLIGHSMGGQIALYIAAVLAPQRVDRLVDVAGVVVGKLSALVERTVFRPVEALYGTPLGYAVELYQRAVSPRLKWAARAQFGSWFHDFDWAPFGWWRIDRDLANRPGMRHTWYHGMKAIQGLDLTPYLPRISAPTQVIFGAQDNVVPVSDGHQVKSLVPDSRLLLIDQCGHFPMYEKPQPYLETVCAFLDGTG